METITVTTAFNNSLVAGRFNGNACLMSNGKYVSFDEKPYTPVGGLRAINALIATGFAPGSTIYLVRGKPCPECEEIKQMIRNSRSK